MPSAEVHRDLKLTTPVTGGPDVKAHQHHLNEIAIEFKRIVHYHLAEDGELGQRTLHATVKAAYIMGLTESRLDEIAKRHLIAQPVQDTLRHPGGRSNEQRKRAEKRREDLRKKLDQPLSLKDVHVTPNAGAPHWGGSNDVVEQYVEPFMVKRGLPIGSGKRTPAENRAVGGSPTSDHLTTSPRRWRGTSRPSRARTMRGRLLLRWALALGSRTASRRSDSQREATTGRRRSCGALGSITATTFTSEFTRHDGRNRP